MQPLVERTTQDKIKARRRDADHNKRKHRFLSQNGKDQTDRQGYRCRRRRRPCYSIRKDEDKADQLKLQRIKQLLEEYADKDINVLKDKVLLITGVTD